MTAAVTSVSSCACSFARRHDLADLASRTRPTPADARLLVLRARGGADSVQGGASGPTRLASSPDAPDWTQCVRWIDCRIAYANSVVEECRAGLTETHLDMEGVPPEVLIPSTPR